MPSRISFENNIFSIGDEWANSGAQPLPLHLASSPVLYAAASRVVSHAHVPHLSRYNAVAFERAVGSNLCLQFFKTSLSHHFLLLSNTRRTRLPAVYRALGDSYVREEFRRHKTAKPEFLKQFFAEWDLYVRTIHEQAAVAPDSIGASVKHLMRFGTCHTTSTDSHAFCVNRNRIIASSLAFFNKPTSTSLFAKCIDRRYKSFRPDAAPVE